MPTLLRLTSRVLVHGPRAKEAESVLPWREREKRKERGERKREEREEKREKVWWRLKKKGRGKRTMERNGGMRITRRKWMVGRNGMWKKVGRGYRKMGRGSTLGSSLLTFILSLLVGARFLAESTIQDGNFLLTQANMRRHERDRVCTPCSRGSRVTGTLSSGVDCTRSG